MNFETPTDSRPWRRKMSAYFLSAGIVLVTIGLMAGIARDLCCSILFATGIVSILVAAYTGFRNKRVA